MGTEYFTSLHKNDLLFRRNKQEISTWTQNNTLATISEEDTLGLAASSEPPWVALLSIRSLAKWVSSPWQCRHWVDELLLWLSAVLLTLDCSVLPTTLSCLCAGCYGIHRTYWIKTKCCIYANLSVTPVP